MKSKYLLNEIKLAVNLSSRRLAKIFRIEQPSFYRYINGVNELNFEQASRILEKCQAYISHGKLVPENRYYWNLIHAINSKNDGNKFDRVSIAMRNLLEFGDKEHGLLSSELISNKQWAQFYEVLINWMLKKPICKRYALKSEWSPLDKIYEYQKDKLHPYFKAHNILLPKGEVQWI